ncbi:MAG: hypothetical protein H6841_08835 [Planctomycetes bacterium]|nr:hypothetical protein [Planctomycetota bacterium]MCB9936140.1 hypothetical protein [Planctomycetota bacterium]
MKHATLALTLALLAALCVAACGSVPPRPEPKSVGRLHNVVRISDWLYSGAQPEGPQDFAALAELGIKTIISVDGARPDVTAAKAAGLRYVHIPFGYDGVPVEARAQLARATAECARPIYVHCHHGKHRGPAGAAIVYRCDSDCTADEAAEIMRVAGTGEEYAGLWRDVKAHDPSIEKPSAQPLAESAEVPGMAARMAEIDRAMDRLKAGDSQAALLVEEGLRECLRFLDERAEPDLRERFERAVANATKARENPGQTEPTRQLAKDCKGCHSLHRN